MQRADAGGRTVAQSIVDAAAAVNRDRSPEPGSIGVVVGATLAEPPDVSALGGPVLVPGVGAQGGRPGGARAASAAPDPANCFPRSRVTCCAPDPMSPSVRAAAEKFRDAVAYLGNARPLQRFSHRQTHQHDGCRDAADADRRRPG